MTGDNGDIDTDSPPPRFSEGDFPPGFDDSDIPPPPVTGDQDDYGDKSNDGSKKKKKASEKLTAAEKRDEERKIDDIPIKQGWLFKKGHTRHNWRHRYYLPGNQRYPPHTHTHTHTHSYTATLTS